MSQVNENQNPSSESKGSLRPDGEAPDGQSGVVAARSALEEEKRCCTVCDAKKRCHVCGSQTLYACSDCAVDFGVTVYVCPTCRRDHEEKCSARLREQVEVANEAMLELYNMVNYALDARDALLISKTCATMVKTRAALGLPALGLLPICSHGTAGTCAVCESADWAIKIREERNAERT